ncbi:MAG: hypothetical protein ACK4R6_12450 [Spirosomataceae bacterium]
MKTFEKKITLISKLYGKKIFHPHIILLLALLFSGCGQVKRVDTAEVKKHINDYKIVKVDNATINLQAEKFGRGVVDSVYRELISSLAICQLADLPLVDSLQKNSRVQISLRTVGQPQSASDTLYPQEKSILEAYQYSFENKLRMDDNLQRIVDTLFIYTRPVLTQKTPLSPCLGNKDAAFQVLVMRMTKADIIKSLPKKKK